MNLLIGYIIAIGAALGTYAVHGSLLALWVPLEYIALIGLVAGAFYGGNSAKAFKATLKALPTVLKGSKYNKALYVDLLAMLYEILSKVRKEGLMSIEGDVENPEGSPVFAKYPELLHDHHVIEFMTDYLRMMVGGNLNTVEIESLMDMELEIHHHEALIPAHAVNKAGDGTPAFGIVVAVMGVVNVMGSVGEPPAVLGKMIGGALVGTFFGVMVAYAIISPVAGLLEQKAEESANVFQCIKMVLLASMSGYAPQVAIEFGRKALSSDTRPTFRELEDEIKARKKK